MNLKRWTMILVTGVLALGLTAGPAYAVDRASVRRPAAHTSVALRSFDTRGALIEAANRYFNDAPMPVISAADLFAAVEAKDASYQIVDVRAPGHYALGHIAGAINIPFTTIADDSALAQLDPTKKIVVVCYTGETASMTTMVWSMLGYDATALMYGMSGWVADSAIVGIDIPTGVAAGYATVQRPTRAHRTFRAPKLSRAYADAAAAVKGQTRKYFAKGLAPVISATDLHAIVSAGKWRSRYQIVSVHQKTDYATGHIKGAINIVWTDIADQLRKLDPSKTIVVYCYTGNTGAQDAMFLNMMGYTTYNLMSGMSSWSNDPAVGGFAGYDPAGVVGHPTVR